MTTRVPTTAVDRVALASLLREATGGEGEIKRALRSTLLRYQLHREQELFHRAHDYVRDYY